MKFTLGVSTLCFVAWTANLSLAHSFKIGIASRSTCLHRSMLCFDVNGIYVVHLGVGFSLIYYLAKPCYTPEFDVSKSSTAVYVTIPQEYMAKPLQRKAPAESFRFKVQENKYGKIVYRSTISSVGVGFRDILIRDKFLRVSRINPKYSPSFDPDFNNIKLRELINMAGKRINRVFERNVFDYRACIPEGGEAYYLYKIGSSSLTYERACYDVNLILCKVDSDVYCLPDSLLRYEDDPIFTTGALMNSKLASDDSASEIENKLPEHESPTSAHPESSKTEPDDVGEPIPIAFGNSKFSKLKSNIREPNADGIYRYRGPSATYPSHPLSAAMFLTEATNRTSQINSLGAIPKRIRNSFRKTRLESRIRRKTSGKKALLELDVKQLATQFSDTFEHGLDTTLTGLPSHQHNQTIPNADVHTKSTVDHRVNVPSSDGAHDTVAKPTSTILSQTPVPDSLTNSPSQLSSHHDPRSTNSSESSTDYVCEACKHRNSNTTRL